MAERHDYTYDLKFFASVTISATDEAEARRQLAQELSHAKVMLGDDGGVPLRTVEASLDGDCELVSVDGEDVE